MIVLETTAAVMRQARHVSIDQAAVERWAGSVRAAEVRPSGHDLLIHLPGTPAEQANLVLLIDALNFCFWSPQPIELVWRGETYRRFEAMLVSIMLAARAERAWADPRFWLRVSAEEIRQVLSGRGQLLMMEERERIIRETGRTLLDRFDGQFIHAVDSVNRRAWDLAVLLMTNFDSFRDVSKYRNQPVFFMKRAQICAMDVSLAWEMQGHPGLTGLEHLAAFADYRLPQALRELGILRLSTPLAEAIERQEEIPADSEEEVEIRAGTIQAVERMRQAAEREGKSLPTWQIDCYLWRLGRDRTATVDHHRTRTIFY